MCGAYVCNAISRRSDRVRPIVEKSTPKVFLWWIARKKQQRFWTRQSLEAIRWNFANAKKRGWKPLPCKHNIGFAKSSIIIVYYFCLPLVMVELIFFDFWFLCTTVASWLFILFLWHTFLWWTKRKGFQMTLFIQFQPTEDRTRFLFLTIRGITSISSRLTLTNGLHETWIHQRVKSSAYKELFNKGWTRYNRSQEKKRGERIGKFVTIKNSAVILTEANLRFTRLFSRWEQRQPPTPREVCRDSKRRCEQFLKAEP